MKAPEEFFTRASLAEYLQVSPSSLWRGTKDGRIPPPILIFGKPRWPRRQIEQWLLKKMRQVDPTFTAAKK